MGFLRLFGIGGWGAVNSMRLFPGSFTVDRGGNVTASTLPDSFPREALEEVAESVLVTFREAREAQVPLTELVVEYTTIKLTARELRGGAIIFLSPRSLSHKTNLAP
jgi:hypothetical protein